MEDRAAITRQRYFTSLPGAMEETTSMSEEVRPRRPWRAVVLSLLAPGLGHVYAGRPRRAAAVAVLYSIAALAGIAVAMRLRGWPHLLMIALVTLGLPIVTTLDAADSARDQPSDYRPHWYNRWYVYLALWVLLALIWQPLAYDYITARIGEAYRIPSGAMSPTILVGDYLTSTPLREAPDRGQIVIFRSFGRPTIKRVMGLPGDTLSMRNGVLRVNGDDLDEPYTERENVDVMATEFEWQRDHLPPTSGRESYQASVHNWGPLVVPAGHYFILGDSRSNSADSRYIGFIPRDSIVGQPKVIYFSRDPESGTIRWRRIGRSLER